MARIRSTHPEQWTDGEFVSCSPLARLLALAIRNEADDRGLFEWKPIVLKMRLLPADNCDVAELLEELIATKQVTRYEVDGRSYGAIRNFTRFQKPKKPHYRHPEPPEVPNPTPSQSATGTEPVPHQGGKPPSVGEGIGIGEERRGPRDLKKFVERSLQKPPPPTGPNFGDAATRKAAWQTKIINELRRTLPEERANALIAAYSAGESWAKEAFERVDKDIKGRRAA